MDKWTNEYEQNPPGRMPLVNWRPALVLPTLHTSCWRPALLLTLLLQLLRRVKAAPLHLSTPFRLFV